MARGTTALAIGAVISALLASCSLKVKVSEDWASASRAIPLGEAAATWADLRAGRVPAKEDLEAYNLATRDSVVQIAKNWAEGGERGSLLRTTTGDVNLRVDTVELPGLARAEEVVPADFVKVRRGLHAESEVSGLGTPLIVRQPRSEFDPLIPETGLWIPVTAFLNLDRPDAPVLELVDPTARRVASFSGTNFPLSANYTAAFARDFQDRQFQFDSLSALLRFEQFADRMGIYRVTPFHPEKEPVVFIHGINSSPSTWDEVLNRLYGDAAIRDRYEFWTFGYPTGAPINYMAAEFRKALETMMDFRASRGATDQRITLVGHSMGGLLAKSCTISSGDMEWGRHFTVPIDQLEISAEERETLRRMFYFEPLPAVHRVVFCAVPHGGSELVNHSGIKLIGSLVEVPSQVLAVTSAILSSSVSVLTPQGLAFATDPLTSIDQLGTGAWATSVFLNKPLLPGVSFHSIIGNNRAASVDLAKSGDGVVPYRSSHLDGVVSELVVRPSGHGVHRTDRGTEEIRRILLIR